MTQRKERISRRATHPSLQARPSDAQEQYPWPISHPNRHESEPRIRISDPEDQQQQSERWDTSTM